MVLLIQVYIDLLNFSEHDIAQIETLDLGASSATNLTLSLANITQLMNSSDTGNLTIASSELGNTLTLDDYGAASGSSVDASTIAAALGASNDGLNLGYYEFGIAGGTLLIEQNLIDGGNTNVI